VIPAFVAAGGTVTVVGACFRSTQGSSGVSIAGEAATITTWSDSSLVVSIPEDATSGDVLVTVNGIGSNPVRLTIR
jgi:hypothetical protein